MNHKKLDVECSCKTSLEHEPLNAGVTVGGGKLPITAYGLAQVVTHACNAIIVSSQTLTTAILLMFTGVLATTVKADGDIETYVWQGRLILFGDDQANDVVIHSYQPGEFTLTSKSTTFNGQPKLVFSGIRHLSVDLVGGDDHVRFIGNDVYANVPKDLFVFMGAGADTVIFEEFHVGRDAWMYLDDIEGRGESGDDTFEAHQLGVYGFMSLRAGSGADNVSFDVEDTAFNYNMALSGARIDLGSHSKDTSGDTLSVESLFTWQGIEVLGTRGDDTIELVDVLTYNGDLYIGLGDGWDELVVRDAEMNWTSTEYPTSIFVSTDGGQNVMQFENIQIRGDIAIKGSNGRDGADFEHVDVHGKLSFEGGGNDDMLFVRFADAQSHAFDGGPGDEDHIWKVSSDLGAGQITGFEIE